MHSVKLRKKLFSLRSSPEFADISLRMLLLNSSRVCGLVLYYSPFNLLTNESHNVLYQRKLGSKGRA